MLRTTPRWKRFVTTITVLYTYVDNTLGLKAVNDTIARRQVPTYITGFNVELEKYSISNETSVESIKDNINDYTELNAAPNVQPEKHVTHEETVRTFIENTFKFRNDEFSTRYKVTGAEFRAKPESPESWADQSIASAFRSYAARRIVGGMETSVSMYPYNVAIAREGRHWCGGSIVDEQWVLTAGHCFESAYEGEKYQLQPFIVRAGSSFHNRGGYQARVNKVFFPKNYVPGAADYDFSLVRLDRPMPIGRNIAVLNLPSSDYVMKEKDIIIVTGWGSTDVSGHGNIPERLRFVPVPVMKLEDCQQSYRFYITPRMVCAGYATGGKDACNHDSGGPAVRDGVLLGVVSFGGKQCGDPHSPGVYARVSEVTAWVEQTITANEADQQPELIDKIQKARARERELQRFKARVEVKKNKIKNWLRETFKSPKFVSLAKKKLKSAGFLTRKQNTDFRRSMNLNLNTSVVDDKTIDDINLSNQIEERILLDGADRDVNVTDYFLRALAFQDVLLSGPNQWSTDTHDSKDSIEAMIEYIAE